MRKFALAATAIALSATAAWADPVAGLWRTQPGDTGGYLHVAIAPCGEKICGDIREAVDGDGQKISDYEHLGKRMLWNMRSNGSGAYAKGKIWAPDRDKTYNSKMQLSGNQLTVEGCVLGVCRGQTWTRVK